MQHHVIVGIRRASITTATVHFAEDNRSTAAKPGARRGKSVHHVKLRSQRQAVGPSSARGDANLVGAIHEQSGSSRERDGLVIRRHRRTGKRNARGKLVQRNLNIAHACSGIHIRRQGRGVHRRRERHVNDWTRNGRRAIRRGCRDDHGGIRAS